MTESPKWIFRAIHISDLHFSDEASDYSAARDKILEEIEKQNLQADCLIISGDLFNRGTLKKNNAIALKEFLRELPGNDSIIVVPGNHDIDRTAQIKEKDSYNIYTTRRTLVNKYGDKVNSDGEFSMKTSDKALLYKKTFQDFICFSETNGFITLCDSTATSTPGNYEIKSFERIFNKRPVRFVLLNTALLAGQAVRGEEYRKRYKEKQKKLQEADSLTERAKIELDLATLQEHFEKDGELIIDEETTGENDNEKGRLSLSKTGNLSLQRIKPSDAILTIFVGHHGIQYLSEKTQKAIVAAMKRCKTEIYLCGHSHKVRYRRRAIAGRAFPENIRQCQAGVVFKDKTDYAQYGFNYLEFTLRDNLEGSVTLHYLIKDASEDYRWVREEIPLSIPLTANQTREANISPVLEPPAENVHNTFPGRRIKYKEPAPNKSTIEIK